MTVRISCRVRCYIYFSQELTKTFPHPTSSILTIAALYFYLLKFSTKAVCGAKTRLKPGAYDSREGLPNNGLHIEGIYVAINAKATPVRLASIKWAIGGIFRDFRFQNKDIRSRLQSSQSCVTPSAIFVFAFPALPVTYCTCSYLIGQETIQMKQRRRAKKQTGGGVSQKTRTSGCPRLKNSRAPAKTQTNHNNRHNNRIIPGTCNKLQRAL